ncbi:MAG: two-component regulator propeller domain-containing protein [Bacteroidota bacterium]|nr:two-component regulator propeller domain-containing protein [Bacteroidota bacterium]
MRKYILITLTGVLLNVLSVSNTYAQGIAIGKWRSHIPYMRSFAVVGTENIIYTANYYGLFYYDLSDNSLGRLDKTNGLSDIGISTIAYNDSKKILVIGYENGNIDLFNGEKVINIHDIKSKQISGSKKSINNIIFKNNLAYLACGFGIVVLDIEKNEIRDTYFIGDKGTSINILSVSADSEYLYAGTEDGIYYAEINSSAISDYNSWKRFTEIPFEGVSYNTMVCYNNKIYANLYSKTYNSDTLYEYDGISWSIFKPYDTIHKKVLNMSVSSGKLIITNYDDIDGFDNNENLIAHYTAYIPDLVIPKQSYYDKNGNAWVASEKKGLVKFDKQGWYKFIYPNGPEMEIVKGADGKNGNIWITSGGYDNSGNNQWVHDGLACFTDEIWKTYNSDNVPGLSSISDIVNVCISPFDNNIVYAGTWNYGILKFENNKPVKVYNKDNSSLDYIKDLNWIRIGGLTFDSDNNLWISNSGVENCLSVLKSDGSWKSFNFTDIDVAEKPYVGDLIVDSYNHKWMILARGHGIVVFNDNNTIDDISDDHYIQLTNVSGQGNLPSTNVTSIAKDADGEIWIGTDKGIAVIYNPDQIFNGKVADAQQIIVTDQSGLAQHLLETETISVIKVDGANQKWIGTELSGVYLMSADGTTQINHFTKENSPLPSNNILNIAINDKTGEVFLITDNGVVSYKGTATAASESNDGLVVYPNPVKENYNGTIAIKGLVNSADVKITDMSGHVVFETLAKGGQAIWNGRNFNNEKVSTGVYMVYISNEDGSATATTKILFIK